MSDKTPSRLDLFDSLRNELDRSLSLPDLNSYIPYPAQLDFHSSQKRGRYIAGGNRGGKSTSIVADALLIGGPRANPYRKRPPEWGNGPLAIRFVVVDIAKGVEQIILPELHRWCPPSWCIKGSFDKSWDSGNLIFTLANGTTMDFVTHAMTLDKHGGVKRHMIYFDEEPPRPVFNENMMRLTDYRGDWAMAASPIGGMTWTYDLLWEPAERDRENSPIDIFNLSMEQNPHIKSTKEDREFQYLGMSEEERRIRESGEFVAKQGLIFPAFGMNLPLYTLDELPPMRELRRWEWWSSVDFGFNNPTAWLWHAVAPDGRILTFAEHYQRQMTVPEHAAVVREKEAAWGHPVENRVGDPAGHQRNGVTGTSYIAEYAERGIYIGTEGIPHEVSIGIEKMQQYLKVLPESPWGENQPTWKISVNCPNLINELKKLRWKAPVSERLAYDSNKGEEVHKKDDHAFDSTRYFFTLMPDLTPVDALLDFDGKQPKTIEYTEALARLSEAEGVEFVDNLVGQSEDGWQTTIYGDFY